MAERTPGKRIWRACGSCAPVASFALLLFHVGALSVAHAQEETGPTVSLVFENDFLAEDIDDKNYTNGVQLEWIARPGRGPKPLHKLGRFLSPDGANAETRAVYGLGHRFYTPDIITTPIPDPNDRPYGAFLYGSIGVLANTADRQLDSFTLTFGVVGPLAQGEELQTFAHNISGAAEPEGWDTQIENQFAFEAEWLRIYRFKLIGQERGWSFEALPQYVVRAGNLRTELGVGGSLRVGRNIPVDFGPPRIVPGLHGSAYQRPVAKFGWYVFGGVNGRYTPRDLFLDEASALGESVTREDFVGDGEVGIAFNFNGVQLAYAHVWRSQAFEEEIGSSKVGSVSLTVNF